MEFVVGRERGCSPPAPGSAAGAAHPSLHVCQPGASATAQEPGNGSLLPRGCPRCSIVSPQGCVPACPVTRCPLPATGSVPREIHRYRLHAALLQTDAEQAPDTEGPGVHRPRVLQLHRLDQVSSPCSLRWHCRAPSTAPLCCWAPPSGVTSQCPHQGEQPGGVRPGAVLHPGHGDPGQGDHPRAEGGWREHPCDGGEQGGVHHVSGCPQGPVRHPPAAAAGVGPWGFGTWPLPWATWPVTRPGWRSWPSSAAVWIAVGWAVASTFRKKERGERLRLLSCPVAVPPACLGAARASSAPGREAGSLDPWSS